MSISTQHLILAGGFAAADEAGIHVYALDAASGALSARASLAGIVNPSFLVVHPDRRRVYAVSETSAEHDGAPGAVWALRFESASGDLQVINHEPSGGDSPCHLQMDATTRWLLVSNYGTGSVAVLSIEPDGALGAMSERVEHEGRGLDRARQAGPHAHSTMLTPDNRFAIVADLGIDRLVVYRFDAAHGRLHAHAQARARPGAGPRHMAFHPDGRSLYVANELDSTVSVYTYDAASGQLSERQTVDTLPDGAPENTVAHIRISAEGRRLFVSNRGHNSIAVFEIAADGRLTRLANYPCGGNWPRHFTLAAGERFVVVANQYSGEVTVLAASTPGDRETEIGAALARAAVTGAACVQYVGGD